MKRTALRTRKASVAPTHFAARTPWDSLADSFEDYISEDLVEYDDEREAVDVVVHGSIHSLN
jgi:hypothetical protein